MIHDPEVEVTCDNVNCQDSIYVTPEYKYQTWSEKSGFYDITDKAIGRIAEKDHDWIVKADKTYCSPECQEEDQP